MKGEKSSRLRELIYSKKCEVALGVHDAFSAKIAEQEGAHCLWASGLGISASMGLRDSNEASWTDVLRAVELMNDAVEIPVLMDADTGFGNFNNVRLLVKRAERLGIAGICLEDKLFPKTNSYINGDKQKLADIEEFCGKIRAAKDSQSDEKFVVVARIEAFIAGYGLGEALKRAEAYRKAGADAILCHSKREDAEDISNFMAEWGRRLPVICVPTTYMKTTKEEFRLWGLGMVIYANQILRSTIESIRLTSVSLVQNNDLSELESNIPPLKQVFDLQNVDELKTAEKKYMYHEVEARHALVLAAESDSTFLEESTPRSMLKVDGKPILEHQYQLFRENKCKTVTIVRGASKDLIQVKGAKYIDNKEFTHSGELYSLFLGLPDEPQQLAISFGDMLFRSSLLNELESDKRDICILVDPLPGKPTVVDSVRTNISFDTSPLQDNVRLIDFVPNQQATDSMGEFTGLWGISKKGFRMVEKALKSIQKRDDWKSLQLADLFDELARTSTVGVRYVHGNWMDVDSLVDLKKARKGFAKKQKSNKD